MFETTTAEIELTHHVRRVAEFMGSRPSIYLLLARHADVAGVNVPLPRGMRRMRLGRCFQNAYRVAVARDDYDYVEGYAASLKLGVPLEHAWLVSRVDGSIVDPTWPDVGSEYLGVRIPRVVMLREAMRLGRYGTLFTDAGINVSLVRERWPDVLENNQRKEQR